MSCLTRASMLLLANITQQPSNISCPEVLYLSTVLRGILLKPREVLACKLWAEPCTSLHLDARIASRTPKLTEATLVWLDTSHFGSLMLRTTSPTATYHLPQALLTVLLLSISVSRRISLRTIGTSHRSNTSSNSSPAGSLRLAHAALTSSPAATSTWIQQHRAASP